jgi:2-amino-4-hydroxy-6-hydroxymethyldihydropteridine diphosphokinase
VSPSPRTRTVHLGLGSNEGDRDRHLQSAIGRLAATPGIAVARVSSFRETAFVGEGPAQGPYRNAVAELSTSLTPQALFAVCKAIEAEAGRKLPSPLNHPRRSIAKSTTEPTQKPIVAKCTMSNGMLTTSGVCEYA